MRQRGRANRPASLAAFSLGLSALLALGPASAAAHAGGEPFVNVQMDHVIAGQPFPVIGADLGPDALVTLQMTLGDHAAVVGHVPAGPDGHFETTCTLPADFPDGYAQLTASQEDGTTAQTYVLVGERDAATGGATGQDPPWWTDSSIALFAALIAVALGALVFLWRRPWGGRE